MHSGRASSRRGQYWRYDYMYMYWRAGAAAASSSPGPGQRRYRQRRSSNLSGRPDEKKQAEVGTCSYAYMYGVCTHM